MLDIMDNRDFDRALVSAVFEQAGDVGWERASVVGAARGAGLELARVRARFPGRGAVLMRFGSLADQAALAEATAEGTPRERLFDLVMRRFDALQEHRAGVLALLRVLPARPLAALALAGATRRSMRWMLEAAGVPLDGLRGQLRVDGLNAIWLNVLRAWQKDDSPDLTGTMAALDRALSRAMEAERWLGGRRGESDDALGEDLPDAEPFPTDLAEDLPPAPAPSGMGAQILPGPGVSDPGASGPGAGTPPRPGPVPPAPTPPGTLPSMPGAPPPPAHPSIIVPTDIPPPDSTPM